MVKLLICGDVENRWDILLQKVDAINSSAHGPFHLLLVCGKTFNSFIHFKEDIIDKELKFAIPTYIYDFGDAASMHGSIADYLPSLPENLHILQENSHPMKSHHIGMCTLPHFNLTLGFIRSHHIPEVENDKNEITREIHEICLSQGYRGCDVLLSSGWPKDCHQFLPEQDIQSLQSLSMKHGIHSGMKAVSDWANVMRPRYHFTSEYQFFYQRPPYRSVAAMSKGAGVEMKETSCIYTRFISLGSVSESKDKDKKWLHALSLEPIITMPTHAKEFSELEAPAGTTENPYISIGSNVAGKGEIEPSMKRARLEADAGDNRGSFFFGTMGVPKQGNDSRVSTVLVPPTPDAKRLFVGGLARDSSEQDLMRLFPGSSSAKRASGKAYAFVDFISHEAANKYVMMGARKGITLHGRTLAVGWASVNQTAVNSHDEIKHDDTSSSKTLFVGGLPSSFRDIDLLAMCVGSTSIQHIADKNFAFINFESQAAAEAMLTQSQLYPLILDEQQLALRWAKGDSAKTLYVNLTQPSADSKTIFVGGIPDTASVEMIQDIFQTAISIRRPEGKDFAFIEFGSVQDAQTIMQHNADYMLDGKSLSLGWAQGKPADKLSISSHAGNCWFCLASPTVAVHLIVSVGSSVYVALPKGGVVDFHVLIVPIDCIPSRIHLSAAAKSEFQAYESTLRQMIESTGQGLIFYERAIRTKGRDHMQEHAVPVLPAHIPNAVEIFIQVARDYQLKFHEIDDDRDIDEVVMTMEGGPYQEYFYISIPTASGINAKRRRFVYIHEDKAKQFQMFFGNEVTARIINKPERANWKNCVINEDAENELAGRFRDAYERFDFTLKE